MRLVITGCGRSGTGYMSAIMQALGYDVRHEREGRDGTSDWHAVGWEWPSLCDYDAVVPIVRHPLDVFRSLRAIKAGSWDYIGAFIPEIHEMKNKLARCMIYWLRWNDWAVRLAGMTASGQPFRVEALNDWWPRLGEYLPALRTIQPERVQAVIAAVPTTVNTRRPASGYPANMTWEMLEKIDGDLVARVRRRAAAYGYCVPGAPGGLVTAAAPAAKTDG